MSFSSESLKSAWLFIVLIASVLAHAQTQTLFFQPPSYTAPGETVTADFNQDGKPDLVSIDGTVLLGTGDGTFRPGTPLNLNGTKPTLIAAADFNGDGKPDVLLTGSSTLLYVFLGKGDGTFEPTVGTNVGLPLTAISAADVNGDGKADILALVPVGNNLVPWEFLANGNGTFAAGVQISGAVPSSANGPFVSGDFNGDGKPDIAIGSQDNNGGFVEVLLGNGDGSFQLPVVTRLGSSIFWGGTMVVEGDFNGDHKLDLVAAASGQFGTEAVTLLGNGDGSFQPPVVAIPASQFLYGFFRHGSVVAAPDLNGDGKDDLIVQADIFPFVEIFTSNGDGTFTAGNSYFEYGPTSGSVLAADFTGDHKPDLAAMGNLLIGNGNGNFQGNPVAYAGAGFTFTQALAGAIGDFKGDGSPDLVTIGDKLYVFVNDGTGKLSLTNTYSVPGGAIATADLNGDGKLDLVTMNDAGSGGGFLLHTLLGNGDGSFGPPNVLFNGTGFPFILSLALADFNGDHRPDVAILSNGELAVFMNNGSGAFGAPTYYFTGAGPTSFVTGDFNNDGKTDVAVVSSAGLGILLGNGDGTFHPVVFPNSGTFNALRAAADLNHDGNTDLIVSIEYEASNYVAVLLGKGDGTFGTVARTLLPDGFSDTVADVNGDGIPDLISAFGFGSLDLVQVVLGRGDGTFGSPIPIISAPYVSTRFTLVTDLNHDGKNDLVLNLDNAVVTFLNVAQPGFTLAAKALSPATVTPGGSATSNITIAPLNGFNATVTLSCSGITLNGSAATSAPPTCSFNPTSVPGGSGTSTLTVSTTASSALLTPAMHRSVLFYALWLPIGGVILIGTGFSPKSSSRKLMGMLLVCLMLSAVLFQAACGGSGGSSNGGGGSGGTPAGTYTITIKAAAGSMVNTTTVTLAVQ
jgi:hypothetical protein